MKADQMRSVVVVPVSSIDLVNIVLLVDANVSESKMLRAFAEGQDSIIAFHELFGHDGVVLHC